MHIVKRLLLVLLGYLVGVLVALLTVVLVYFILSGIPGAPSYFSTVALSLIVMIAVPPVGMFVYYFAVILTALPSLAAALISEVFSLRQLWLLAPLGAAIGAGGFMAGSPTVLDGIEGTDWADLAIMAVGGCCGGVTYWLIAGRKAGFSRPLPVAMV
jgi:hypothetical protein